MSARRPSDRLIATLAVVAIVIAAAIGYVSYNALTGLPFEKVYRLSVDAPDAKRLIATNDVRIAGLRVGRVDRVVVKRDARGRAFSRIDLALDRGLKPLRRGTTVRIRPASVLGASYVELTPSRSGTPLSDGDILPASVVGPTVDLTDLFDVFERRSARSFQAATRELATGVAGRGATLNKTFQATAQFLPPLVGVASTLASRPARLDRLIQGGSAASAAVAPVAPELAGIMGAGAQTFGALRDAGDDLGRTIDALPPAEAAATDALTRISRPLHGLAHLMTSLRPAARKLPVALDELDKAYRAAVRPLDRLPGLTAELRPLVKTLGRVSRRPSTSGALRKLPRMLAAANTTLDTLVPAQKQCNMIGLSMQNLSSYIGTIGVGEGPAYAMFGVATTGGLTDNIQAREPSPDLHVNYEPKVGYQECEPNNEPYSRKERALGGPSSTVEPATARRTTPPPGALARAAEAGLLGKRPPSR